MAAVQIQNRSFSVSVVFCYLWQHHQAFVSAEVPPPYGSIMKLQHERGRLSIKMTSMTGVYSDQVFKELRITTASTTVSHGLFNFCTELKKKNT